MRDAREGEQAGDVVNALSKSIPLAAKRSRLGVGQMVFP